MANIKYLISERVADVLELPAGCLMLPEGCYVLPVQCAELPEQCGRLPEHCGRVAEHCGGVLEHCGEVREHCGEVPERCGGVPVPTCRWKWPFLFHAFLQQASEDCQEIGSEREKSWATGQIRRLLSGKKCFVV